MAAWSHKRRKTKLPVSDRTIVGWTEGAFPEPIWSDVEPYGRRSKSGKLVKVRAHRRKRRG